MKTSAGILALLILLSGCASVGPRAGIKGHPRAYEQEAKTALQGLFREWEAKDSRGVKMDAAVEAVWIGKEYVLLRVSWQKFPEEVTGSAAMRHMADFVFWATNPMTLQRIEGENPFL